MDLAFIQIIICIFLIFKINSIKGYGRKLTSYENNEYYIDNEQKYSWFESLIACIEMDMTLVSIETSTKSNEINTLVRNNFGKVNLWIGGIMSRFPYRHFIWLSTGKPFSFTFWQGNNPDFYGNNEYCAHIGWGSNLEWNDIACTNHQGFICEHSKSKQDNKKIQASLKNEQIKLQNVQQQLQQQIQKQQELQNQIQQTQTQQETLKQELEKAKEAADQANQKHLKLQDLQKKQLEKQEQKLRDELEKNEKLEKDFQEAILKQYKLEQDLQMQQNLKDLAQDELQKYKDKDLKSVNDTNKKYRDIILHFHQNN